MPRPRQARANSSRLEAERLFSIVGIAFSDKRKSASASTLASIAFTKVNL